MIFTPYLVPLAKTKFAAWVEIGCLLDGLKSFNSCFILVSSQQAQLVSVVFAEKRGYYTLLEHPMKTPAFLAWQKA